MNPQRAGNRALRIVLFGRPGAGKSSLLAALAGTRDAPEEAGVLQLHDPANVLGALRRQFEAQPLAPTLTPEQVVPYPLVFDLSASGGPGDATDVVVIDCDGNAALPLLVSAESRDEARPLGRLVEELQRADAVILVVPGDFGAATEDDVAALEHFLQWVEEQRGRAVAVGGLPVLPALTKCDLLARKDDTADDWRARVAQHAAALDGRFERFRAERTARSASVFGQIELLPALPTAALPPGLPGVTGSFGVAELFRQGMEQASRYRHSQGYSTFRLLQTSVILLFLVACLVVLAVFPIGLQSQADREAVREAVEQEVGWYDQLKDRATTLDNFTEFRPEVGGRVPWASWNRQVEKLFHEAQSRAIAPDEKVAGADTATYVSVLDAPKVQQARFQWQERADSLRLRRDLAAALGLVEGQSPVLKVPPTGFTVQQSAGLLRQLQDKYPRYQDWSLDGWPLTVAHDVGSAAEGSAENLLSAGQKEILAQLQRLSPDGKETPQLWHKFRAWLQAAPELHAWRELAHVLLRLYDPLAEDPVDRLKTFLGQSRYEIELQRLVLKVPNALKVAPAGKLVIYHGVGDDVRSTLTFRLLDDGRRADGDQATRYVFVPEGGETLMYRLDYRPGDTLWAELPMRGPDGRDRVFTWSVCRSQVFQFERLVRPPRLHRKDQPATQGELVQGAALIVAVGIVPRLPDLIPVVKLVKRGKSPDR